MNTCWLFKEDSTVQYSSVSGICKFVQSLCTKIYSVEFGLLLPVVYWWRWLIKVELDFEARHEMSCCHLLVSPPSHTHHHHPHRRRHCHRHCNNIMRFKSSSRVKTAPVTQCKWLGSLLEIHFKKSTTPSI